MENFIIAILTVAVIIVFSVINCVKITNLCEEMIALTEEGYFNIAYDLWQENKVYLSLFIHDPEIDEADEVFRMVEGGDSDSTERLIEVLRELLDSEKPLLVNLL